MDGHIPLWSNVNVLAASPDGGRRRILEVWHTGQRSSPLTEETAALSQACGPLVHKYTRDVALGGGQRQSGTQQSLLDH